MKVCIISGRYPETLFNAPINHKVYADIYGYTYIHCNWPTKEKNPYLNKIHYILNYMDHYDYIIWLDDDAFFFDFSMDIMKFAPKDNQIISICKSPSFKELKTFLSSGQFILKSNGLAKKFLNKILKQNTSEIKDWWHDDLGFYTKGDQDIIVYLLHTDEEFIDRYCLYDYKVFNSRPENLFGIDPHKPLILHFTGRPEIKMANYKKVQKEFNLHESLVSQNLLEAYHIVKKNSIPKNTIKKKIKKNFRWLFS